MKKCSHAMPIPALLICWLLPSVGAEIELQHPAPQITEAGHPPTAADPLLSELADGSGPQLTTDRIFGKGDLNAKTYSGRWLNSGHGYTRLEPVQMAFEGDERTGQEIVQYDAATGQRRILVTSEELKPDDESPALSVDDYTFSDDMSLVLIFTNATRVWREKSMGDYWVLDRASHQLQRIAPSAAKATSMFAKFSPDGTRVAYVTDGNIYVDDLRSHRTVQLTARPKPEILNGTFDWTYEEEFGIRDGFRWSPDGTRIAYWRLDTSEVPKFTMINNTDSLYPRTVEFAHSKVGQKNAATSIHVIDTASHSTQSIELPGNPSENYIARMSWVDHQTLEVRQLNRLQNREHVWLAAICDGTRHLLLEEQDEAWVDVHDEMFWFDDARRCTWLSERSGWRQIYVAERPSKSAEAIPMAPQRLTHTEYDVVELLHLDTANRTLYFLASPDNPTQRYLYRVGLDGTTPERVSPAEQQGWHSYQIAPNGKWAMHTFSTANSPPTIQLVSLPDHATVRVLEDNSALRQELDKLILASVEFLHAPTDDGQTMDGYCIGPKTIDPGRKYPLLVYVYGEPAGSTVADRWGGNASLWHHMLAQRGCFIMSFDNRGTNVPRGRAWRKSIYRQVGVLAPKDQASALRYVLAERPYLDKSRIGIWGWSGGGSMSLNAIFKYPELYQVAISIAPVPNQRYYDTIYQERYMGLPADNADGYLDGSPINFAAHLQGKLLLIHGTGDDNCHYQTMELLINELVRHNKPFSMMAYPNRTHSIREGSNTTLHLRTLMSRYLEDHLLP